VEVLASLAGEPVLVREGRVLAATFHTELGDGAELQRVFVEMALRRGPELPAASLQAGQATRS
jgi:5'-phosphate synthase pdxT subunit